MRRRVDVKRTGAHLKKLISGAGYTVADVQDYLGLSCPQAVYRWYHGRTLPCVDHFMELAALLNRHIDDLIIVDDE